MKTINDPNYRLQGDYTNYHSHSIPVFGIEKESKDETLDPEEKSAQ